MAIENEGRTESAGPRHSGSDDDIREVVVELLKQHQALLVELRWAYGQLERVQEVDISGLKQRVSELEQRRPGTMTAKAASASTTSKFRKRMEFTLRHPDMAARAAGRKLRRPLGQAARRSGFSR